MQCDRKRQSLIQHSSLHYTHQVDRYVIMLSKGEEKFMKIDNDLYSTSSGLKDLALPQ